MFNRTTSFIFSKYGEVFRSMPDDESSFMKNAHVSNVRLRDKQIHYYMNYDRPVYIRALSGVIMLIVAPKSDPANRLFRTIQCRKKFAHQRASEPKVLSARQQHTGENDHHQLL